MQAEEMAPVFGGCFVLFFVLAFSEWPIQKQVKQLQQQLASPNGPQGNFRNL
jgi:hypothetical protein